MKRNYYVTRQAYFRRRPQIQAQSSNTDNKRARSEATKNSLMHAAEQLIAERGIENVSIRDIVSAANQKNESVLQYHFKNLTGLIEAIQLTRSAQTQKKRAELIETLSSKTTKPSIKEICMLLVQPSFQLACEDSDYCCYIKAFGHKLILTDASPAELAASHGGGGLSGQQASGMLKLALPHLDSAAYQRRIDAAVMLCSTSMYHQARQKNSFNGDQAQLFLHSLVDALVGLFSAAVSPQTQALWDKLK